MKNIIKQQTDSWAIAQFPAIYRQGPGILGVLPALLESLKAPTALVLAGRNAWAQARESFAGLPNVVHLPFGGECTSAEIESVAQAIRAGGHAAVVGLGGGKVIDTARAAAHLAGDLPFISAPTIASTDAPISATAVVYQADGTFSHYLRNRNPAAVLVDTSVIVRAPVRYLVAGLGDALSTWFEAESCRRSGAANVCGGQATLATGAIARLCYDTILSDGPQAVSACQVQQVTPAFERVVEANTLLSGLGFESGGLASAHSIHNGLTRLPGCHHALHGEKVAFGVLAGLVLTGASSAQIQQVLEFNRSVGLPMTLAQLGCSNPTQAELESAAETACAVGESIHNESMAISPGQVLAAIRTADRLGTEFYARPNSAPIP
jgi:glycerol dehydrogenase